MSKPCQTVVDVVADSLVRHGIDSFWARAFRRHSCSPARIAASVKSPTARRTQAEQLPMVLRARRTGCR